MGCAGRNGLGGGLFTSSVNWGCGRGALTVVLEQMGFEDSVFEEVNVEFIVDSQILNSSSLISKGYFVGMDVAIFVVASVDTKAENFVELVELVRLVTDVFEHYSNKD